jgi:hypothetical protein
MIRGEAYGDQIVKFLFTIALQAIALTSFIASSKK